MVEYYIPQNLEDALKAMQSRKYSPYAGGTDLNTSGFYDRNLLFIGKLPELRNIRDDGKYIRIGAAVTYSEAVKSELIPEIMKTAIHKVAGPAIRNSGTFGGNLANASGKADSALVDLVLDAKIRICSVSGERLVNAVNFYQGRKKVDLQPDELICEILIPKKDYQINYFYDKVSVRSSIAISNISIASIWKIEQDRIRELAIGIGSATDYPVRCYDIEQLLVGKSLEEVEKERENILSGFVVNLDLPLDRTDISYRKQVCYRLLNYLLYEEFTPIHLK
ncbi:MAG: FAD binding domain-containing protein [Eubacteriales bacterium]|nr:FAD binding domain-containing protein [Eubacteriales bacterium]